MIALYIIGAIVLLLILILSLDLQLFIGYKKENEKTGQCAVWISVGSVRIKLYPKKKKKIRLSNFSPKKYKKLTEAESVKNMRGDRKSDKKKERFKKTSLPGGIGEIFELVSELVEKFSGRLTCDITSIKIDVGTGAAASTALLYTGVTSAVEFLIEFLRIHTRLTVNPDNIRILPDFNGDDICADISFKFKIKIAGILRAGGGFILNYLRTMVRLDNQNSNKRNKAERRNGDKS